MPFCPKCKYEYVKNIDTCHDCGEKLTDELPDDIKHSEIKTRWKPLQNLPGRIYAEMAKEIFDEKGIPSFIKSTFFSSAYGTRGVFGDTATIFVPDDKLEECSEIIKQIFNHI